MSLYTDIDVHDRGGILCANEVHSYTVREFLQDKPVEVGPMTRQAAETLPEERRSPFLRFVRTGEADKPFLDYLETSKEGKAAVKVARDEQAKGFEGIAKALKAQPKDPLQKPPGK